MSGKSVDPIRAPFGCLLGAQRGLLNLSSAELNEGKQIASPILDLKPDCFPFSCALGSGCCAVVVLEQTAEPFVDGDLARA